MCQSMVNGDRERESLFHFLHGVILQVLVTLADEDNLYMRLKVAYQWPYNLQADSQVVGSAAVIRTVQSDMIDSDK